MVSKERDDRKECDFISDLTIILDAHHSLHRHTLRGTVWKLIDDFSGYLRKTSLRQHGSTGVIKKIKGNPTSGCESSKDVYEHVVPTGIITRYLAPPKGDLPEKVCRDKFVHKLFSEWLTVCWVTSDENRILGWTPANPDASANGKSVKRLKDHMPLSWEKSEYLNSQDEIAVWCDKFKNCWCRYAAVNTYWTQPKNCEDGIAHLAHLKMDEDTFYQAIKIAPEMTEDITELRRKFKTDKIATRKSKKSS